MKKTKVLTVLSGIILAGLIGVGCTTTLTHKKLEGSPNVSKGRLGVSARAEGMPTRVGWGTLTVFAIPVAPVTLDGQPDQVMMNQIKDAVEQCGYRVKFVQNLAEAGGLPVLSCRVKRFSFRNYTWLFPVVFNWGKISMDVSVTGPDGRLLWAKSYTAKGRHLRVRGADQPGVDQDSKSNDRRSVACRFQSPRCPKDQRGRVSEREEVRSQMTEG